MFVFRVIFGPYFPKYGPEKLRILTPFLSIIISFVIDVIAGLAFLFYSDSCHYCYLQCYCCWLLNKRELLLSLQSFQPHFESCYYLKVYIYFCVMLFFELCVLQGSPITTFNIMRSEEKSYSENFGKSFLKKYPRIHFY